MILANGLVMAVLAAGELWGIAPVEAVNIHEGHAAAARAVLGQHVESLGGNVVMLEVGEGQSLAVVAAEKGAPKVLRLALTRLGNKVKAQLVVERADGSREAVANLDAASPEDLDTVLLRLVRHLLAGEPLAEARIAEVTEQEEEAYKRKRANSYFGIAVTGAPVAAGDENAFLAGLSMYWLYDARHFLADVQVGFGAAQSGSDSSGGRFDATVAVLYPLLDRDVTPYVGGGFGYGTLGVSGNDGGGLLAFGSAGVIIGRTSTVHARLDARPFVTFFDTGDGSGYGAVMSAGVGF